MEDKIIDKITSIYNRIMEKPNIIYNIFKDFYGEKYVDMQNFLSLEDYAAYMKREFLESTILDTKTDLLGYRRFQDINILVRFPEVRVTNENDKYIDIWELYAKIYFNCFGLMTNSFVLNRSEYDVFQFRNLYLHSHVPGISYTHLADFQSPCLGQGPIRATIGSLFADFDELRWQLFCFELSKYVEVESLSGGPYKKLESLGSNSMRRGEGDWYMNTSNIVPEFTCLPKDKIKEFVEWLIKKKKFVFDYYNGSYNIGMSYINWRVFISNEFIEWYNIQFKEGHVTATYEDLLDRDLLKKGIISNNFIYYDSQYSVDNFTKYVGQKICTFKGKDVTLVIRDLEKEKTERNFSNFLNPLLAEYIYKCILKVLNYKHGRYNTQKTETTGVGTTTIYL